MPRSSLPLSLFLLAASACGGPPPPPEVEPGAETLQEEEPAVRSPGHSGDLTPAALEQVVTEATLMETVRWLASPELEGRLAGSHGYRQAAGWAAERFRSLGLEPAGAQGDFLQRFRLELNEIERCDLTLSGWEGEPLVQGRDWSCRGFSGSGRVKAPVVFVGYGLSEPERGYDDYQGLDVQGKLVLAFKRAPAWSPVDDEGWGEAWMPRPKAATAVAHGALGVLTVVQPSIEWSPRPIGSVMHGPGVQARGVPQVELDRPLGEWLVHSTGTDLAGLQARIDEAKAPASAVLGREVEVEVRAWYEEQAPSANVVALLRGADPELRDEYVVIGAHLDHVGLQGEVVYPGANDNASGSASVLAIAEAMARSVEPPARSVIFALWAAEESGLLGATHFVENPLVPVDKVVAALNLDCVGHGSGTLKLGGKGASPSLWELARSLDSEGITVEESWYGGGADLQPFFDAGVPTLYFATEDSYTHLHKPGDTPETLDPALLTAVARLAGRTTSVLAQGAYQREERAPKPQ